MVGDERVCDLLDPTVVAEMRAIPEITSEVSARDLRFGLSHVPPVSVLELLDLHVNRIGLPGLTRGTSLGIRLHRLAELARCPATLREELRSIPEPHSPAIRALWGWNGQPPRSLSSVAAEFHTTPEKLHREEEGWQRSLLADRPIYLLAGRRLVALLDKCGGMAPQPKFVRLARAQGLIGRSDELRTLYVLSILGFLGDDAIEQVATPSGPVVRSRPPAPPPVAKLRRGREKRRTPQPLAPEVRSALSRRGIVAVAEIGTRRRKVRPSARHPNARRLIAQHPDIEMLGGGTWIWRPRDLKSPFYRRITKPLVIIGPQSTRVLARGLRRALHAHEGRYGPAIPTDILEEALERSPYIERGEDQRWTWTGPRIKVSLGPAEEEIVLLLWGRGPAMAGNVIRSEVASLSQIAVQNALSHSPLFERVAPNVYALAGTRLLPSNINEARAQAQEIAPATALLRSGWIDDAFEVEWRIDDVHLWSGSLSMPSQADLQGEWRLVGRHTPGATTVRGSQVWGGIQAWVVRRFTTEPVWLRLRFNHASRTIAPSLLPPPAKV